MSRVSFSAGATWLSAALLCGVAVTANCSSAIEEGTGATSGMSSGQGGQTTTSGSGPTTTPTTSGSYCGVVGEPCCAGSCNQMGAVCVGGVCALLVQFGGACTMNEECDSKVCLESGHCSKPCAGAADCPPAPEWSCAPLASDPADVCQCASSGPDVCDGQDNDCDGIVDNGAMCPETGYTCQSGACACDPANLCGGTCTDIASDTQNCGACGMKCATGAVCSAGHCLTTLVSGQSAVSIAVDATSLYWTSSSGNSSGTVMKMSLGGGAPILLASGQPNANHIALGGNHVYWVNGGDPGTVMKGSIDGGGTPTTLASGQTYPWGIAVDATNVYWANSGNPGAMMKVPLDGGAPTSLASGQVTPFSVAVDATSVYWAGFGGSAMKVPLAGGAPTTLAPGMGKSAAPNSIAVDATSVYWTSDNAVMKVPLGGGTITTLASGVIPFGIAVDASSVYWTTGDAVMKVPIGGGAPTALASGQSSFALAVDATSVYWTNSDAVMKTPK